MPAVSDLVRDSKLRTSIQGGITRHVIETSGHGRGQRKDRKEQKWQRTEIVGEGSFGRVWKEILIEGESDVAERAIKMVRKPIQRSEAADYSRELEAIAKFSHPKYRAFFVESYGWFESEIAVFITMEFLPYGDLQKLLEDRSRLLELEVQQISLQVLEGLAYMHENGFAHRDLKPSNILIKEMGPKWWVKIADFGISKRAEEGVTQLRTFSGTLGFLAPEILIQNGMLDAEDCAHERGYTFAVDIWSVGEIIFRCLCGDPSFEHSRSLASYVKGNTPFPSTKLLKHDVTEYGQTLCGLLMAVKPNERPTAPQALEHSWFALLRDSPRSSLELPGAECAGSIPHISSLQIANDTEAQVSFDWIEASARWSTLPVPTQEEGAEGLAASTQHVRAENEHQGFKREPELNLGDSFPEDGTLMSGNRVMLDIVNNKHPSQKSMAIDDFAGGRRNEMAPLVGVSVERQSGGNVIQTTHHQGHGLPESVLFHRPTYDSKSLDIYDLTQGQADRREHQSGASMDIEAVNILSTSVIVPSPQRPESVSSMRAEAGGVNFDYRIDDKGRRIDDKRSKVLQRPESASSMRAHVGRPDSPQRTNYKKVRLGPMETLKLLSERIMGRGKRFL